LYDWKATAEQRASAELNGIPVVGPTGEELSIAFKAEGWSMTRNRGTKPGDAVVMMDGWRRGDVCYSVRLRLKNNLTHEEVLHRFRMEFMAGPELIRSDKDAFDDEDVILTPGKWVKVDVDFGVRDFSVIQRATSVWCKAEVVGNCEVVRWRVAEIDHKSLEFDAD
jgi:hypothetical protein